MMIRYLLLLVVIILIIVTVGGVYFLINRSRFLAPGQACGGNTTDSPKESCPPGYVCLNKNHSLPAGDVGGTCVKNY